MTIVTRTTGYPTTGTGNHCTVEVASSNFCDAPAWPDAPFPICRKHAIQLYMEMRGIHHDAMINASGFFPSPDSNVGHVSRDIEREKMLQAAERRTRSVVYYVRIGPVVKIGYTSNLIARMAALRVSRSDVLATEPGGRELEARRHGQFGRLRKGKREDFEPTFELIQHIDAVRERHGDPVFKQF
jgi:hypothetical protein